MDKILPLLRKNARASIADLAKATSLSEAEVARRIEKLEEENASFVKDMKLQSYRLAELEAWTDENQGI